MTPKFSIIIPTYNRNALLKRALESVIRQTFNSYETIIVDDGSIDKTELIVKKFIKENKKIQLRYFKLPNKGTSAARNFGVSKARGNFIAFLDDDDELLPSYLEEVNKLKITQKIFIIRVSFFYNYPIFKKDISFNPRLSCRPWEIFIGGSVILSKNIFTDLNLWFNEDLRGCEDLELGIRCYQKHIPVFFIDKVLYRYYLKKPWEEHSVSTSIKLLNSSKFLFTKYYNFFESNGKEALLYIYTLFALSNAFHSSISTAKTFFIKAFQLSKNVKYLIYWFVSLFGQSFFGFFII